MEITEISAWPAWYLCTQTMKWGNSLYVYGQFVNKYHMQVMWQINDITICFLIEHNNQVGKENWCHPVAFNVGIMEPCFGICSKEHTLPSEASKRGFRLFVWTCNGVVCLSLIKLVLQLEAERNSQVMFLLTVTSLGYFCMFILFCCLYCWIKYI